MDEIGGPMSHVGAHLADAANGRDEFANHSPEQQTVADELSNESGGAEASLQDISQAESPFGALGPKTDRDRTTGRFVRGNRAAVITGTRSARFWAAAEAQREQLTVGILRDHGFENLAEAPVALRLAAQGAAQAEIIRDSAFARLVECGGPLSGSDRERGAHRVWAAACDRLLRHIQVLGLARRSRTLPSSLEAFLDTGGQP